MPVGDLFRVKAASFLRDQLGLNVLYYETLTETAGDSNPTSLAAAFALVAATAYKAAMSDEARYIGQGVTQLFPVATAEFWTNDGAGVGVFTGDALPSQTCGILTKKSVAPGRRGRGRVYVPFPAETANDTKALPNAGYLTALSTLATALGANVTVNEQGGWQAVLRPVIAAAIPGGGYSRLAITQLLPRPRWATQRSRGSYGAANLPPV